MTALALARTWAEAKPPQRVRYSASGWVRLGTVVDWEQHGTALVRFDGDSDLPFALPVSDLMPLDAVGEQAWVEAQAGFTDDMLSAARLLAGYVAACPGTANEKLTRLGTLLDAVNESADAEFAEFNSAGDAKRDVAESEVTYALAQLVHGPVLVCADCLRLADDPGRVRLAVTAGPVPQCAYHAPDHPAKETP